MTEISTKVIKENLGLFATKVRLSLFKLTEFMQIALSYYSNIAFMRADLSLTVPYLFDSPFEISKRFLKENKAANIYSFGETPLPAMEIIADTCEINAEDHVFELGCGTGRICFWLHFFRGCQVTGIDYIPKFVDHANKIKNKFKLQHLNFVKEDLFEATLEGATVIYLYGTTLEDFEIEKLVKKFEALPTGTKIITVSYPLNDYTVEGNFELLRCFSIKYPWGSANVYMQVKK